MIIGAFCIFPIYAGQFTPFMHNPCRFRPPDAKKQALRRLVIGIYQVQHSAFSPVGSPTVLERHPVFHRPAEFPTEQKSQHCTAAHPKGHEIMEKPRQFLYCRGFFVDDVTCETCPLGRINP